MGRWVAAQSRPSEHEDGSDYGRPQLPLDGAHDCAQPPEYAASIASTANSRQTNPLYKALRNLQKAIAKLEEGNDKYKANKREKIIAFETKLMMDCAKKLSDRVDVETDIEETFLVVIEETLEKAESLAFYATLRLDELATLKEEEKALMQARPKLTYKTFKGDAGTFGTFQRNQKEIYKAFEKKEKPSKYFNCQRF